MTITGVEAIFSVLATLTELNTGEGEGMVKFTVSGTNGGSWQAFLSRPLGTTSSILTDPIPPGIYTYTLEFVDMIGTARGRVTPI